MLYLLDASVLITAHNSYYPIDRVPEYWEWLQYICEQGHVKVPLENFEEIKDGPTDEKKDLLFAWLQEGANRNALIFKEDVVPDLVQHAVSVGYAPDLTDDEVEQLGRDPFLLAYAMKSPADRCVVTVEVSKPSRKRQNRHLPDVCKSMGVTPCDPFKMNKVLGFSTKWKKP